MIQVKLINVITSFTSLSRIVVGLTAVQVLRCYLQAHLDLQTMYNVIYIGEFRFINVGFSTVFITFRRTKPEVPQKYF